MSSVAARVTQLIKASGATVNHSAIAMGMEASTLFRIANGSRPRPRPATLKQIADFYKTTVEWLSTGEGEAPLAIGGVKRKLKLPDPVVIERFEWEAIVRSLGVADDVAASLNELPTSVRTVIRNVVLGSGETPWAVTQNDQLRTAVRHEYLAWLHCFREWIDTVGKEAVREQILRHPKEFGLE